MTLSTVQVDVDGLWVLLRMVGGSTGMDDDPVLASGLPRILDLFSYHRIRATFFVNAFDVSVPSRRRLLERIAVDGHEIANHGLSHRYLTALDAVEKEREIVESTDRLARFAGAVPRGFRAAGCAVDADVPAMLERLGYLYDSSAFPVSVMPAIVAAQRLLMTPPRPRYAVVAPLRSPRSAYRPARRDLYRRGDADLWEVPITTLPMLRLPLHFSYGILLGRRYLGAGVESAVRRHSVVNFLFHVRDLADDGADGEVRTLRWLHRGLDERLHAAHRVLEVLRRGSEILATSDLCARLPTTNAVAR